MGVFIPARHLLGSVYKKSGLYLENAVLYMRDKYKNNKTKYEN